MTFECNFVERISNMTNYIEKLNTDIQGYINNYLPHQLEQDWILACQGDEIVDLVMDEIENQEDLSIDWRDQGRGKWEDDFDWDETWNHENYY